jgi:DNA-binding MarR family transcriptional regulator
MDIKFISKNIKQYELKAHELMLLDVIMWNPTLSVQKIGEAFGTSHQCMSNRVAALKRKGYIKDFAGEGVAKIRVVSIDLGCEEPYFHKELRRKNGVEQKKPLGGARG